MYLYLLALTYALEDRELVEADLAHVHPEVVLISMELYDDELLAVVASRQEVEEVYETLTRHPAVSSCVKKHCPVYHVITSAAPEQVLRTFPLREGEEWYQGEGRSVYLCVQSPLLSARQVSWIATSTQIASWEYWFDLVPVSAQC